MNSARDLLPIDINFNVKLKCYGVPYYYQLGTVMFIYYLLLIYLTVTVKSQEYHSLHESALACFDTKSKNVSRGDFLPFLSKWERNG